MILEDLYLIDYNRIGPQAYNKLYTVVKKYGKQGLYNSYNIAIQNFILEGHVAVVVLNSNTYVEDAIIYSDGSVIYNNRQRKYLHGGTKDRERLLVDLLSYSNVKIGPSIEFIELYNKYKTQFEREQNVTRF